MNCLGKALMFVGAIVVGYFLVAALLGALLVIGPTLVQ